VADSEGTLVTMQVMIALHDAQLAALLGYAAVLPPPAELIAGVVLSSPVVDLRCETPSMYYNCYNFSDPRAHLPGGVGDPDTGDCRTTPTAADVANDCLSSYLEYFFGFAGILDGTQPGQATREVHRRAAFFAQRILTPLAYDLRGFPPLLTIAGTRDFYYSDGPALARRACEAGVDVTAFNAEGTFHDFIEYSEGCGGGAPAEESIEAFRRVAAFAARLTASPSTA
jgi:acetyl esterase/lipase